MFRLDLAGQSGLADLAKDLKRAGGSHRRRLAASLREPTEKIYEAVREDIHNANMSARRVRGARRFPNDIGRGNHVKKPTAAAVNWKVSTSAGNPRAEVTFNPNKVPARVRALFPYWVGQKTRLRHPIMGKARDGSWRGGVSQRLPDVWKQTRRYLPEAQRAVAKAVDDTAAIIGGRK
jgi:hypothetical protein